MRKIVFICKGNMHRSVVAMALFNILKKDDSFAVSCGTMVDAGGRTGRTEASYTSLLLFINELKNNYGIDVSNHICTQVVPEILEDADKIIMIAEDYSIPDWLREYKYIKWELPDPENMTEEDVVEDVKRIKVKVEDLLSVL